MHRIQEADSITEFQGQAWCQVWARGWAVLASACCHQELPNPWGQTVPHPACCRGSLRYPPALASQSQRRPAPASALAEPCGEGAGEPPEAARPAPKGFWPMLRLHVASVFFLLSLLLLAFPFNANLESLSQERGTVARKKR